MNNADELIEKFNEKFPVGTTVLWRAAPSAPHRPYTVQLAAANHSGKAVCWFYERTGISPIEPENVNYNGGN